MKTSKVTLPTTAADVASGFHVSDEPVVQSYLGAESSSARLHSASNGKSMFEHDAYLSILARDPKSLFVSWTLARQSAADESGERPRHLRVLGQDGSEEASLEIDPAVGFAFVEVSSPAARYTCELGYFEGSEWKCVLRSGSAELPASTVSEDLAVDFATVPFHLSFQRLVDIFRAQSPEKRTLVASIAKMQAEARALQASVSPVAWSKLIAAATELENADATFGMGGVRGPELAALLQNVDQDLAPLLPSPEKLKRWREIGERCGGASWGGSSPGGDSSS